MQNSTPHRKWIEKYHPHQFNDLLQDFASNKTSLAKLSELVGASTETIRQDFIRELGKKQYTKLIKHKHEQHSAVSSYKKGLFSNFDEALANLPFIQLHLASITITPDAITQLSTHFPQASTISFFKKRITFAQNNKNFIVRWAFPKRESKDYIKGVHRFKIVEKITEYDKAVFLIIDTNKILTYQFTTQSIHQLKTLSLRLSPPFTNYKYTDRLLNSV